MGNGIGVKNKREAVNVILGYIVFASAEVYPKFSHTWNISQLSIAGRFRRDITLQALAFGQHDASLS